MKQLRAFEPSHTRPRESHFKGENPVDQQAKRRLSLLLSACVAAHSCPVPSEKQESQLQAGTRLMGMNWN